MICIPANELFFETFIIASMSYICGMFTFWLIVLLINSIKEGRNEKK